MKSITETASAKELEILKRHYQVPDIDLSTPAREFHNHNGSSAFVTRTGWRITLYDSVEPLAEAPGTWTAES